MVNRCEYDVNDRHLGGQCSPVLPGGTQVPGATLLTTTARDAQVRAANVDASSLQVPPQRVGGPLVVRSAVTASCKQR